MSSIVSGDQPARGKGSYRANSSVRAESYLNNPVLSPVSRLKDYVGQPSKVGLAKPKNIPRTFVPTARPPAKKPVAKPAPQVIRNVTREKLSSAPAKAPAFKAVSMRTGDTTGVTTGKTTGTVARTPGMATKTKQSAYDRQMANAARNQPAGPMGGGGGSSSRGGSLGGGGASRTSSGGGNLGGARGRISEPGGSKR